MTEEDLVSLCVLRVEIHDKSSVNAGNYYCKQCKETV